MSAAAHKETTAPSLGLGNAVLKNDEGQGEAKWGGGRYKWVRRDRVRERGKSCSADSLGGIRSKICWLGTFG